MKGENNNKNFDNGNSNNSCNMYSNNSYSVATNYVFYSLLYLGSTVMIATCNHNFSNDIHNS